MTRPDSSGETPGTIAHSPSKLDHSSSKLDPYILLDVFTNKKLVDVHPLVHKILVGNDTFPTKERRLILQVVTDGKLDVHLLLSLCMVALDRVENTPVSSRIRIDAIQLVAALTAIKFPLLAYKIIDECIGDPDDDVRQAAALYSAELPLMLFDALMPKLTHHQLIDPCPKIRSRITTAINSFNEERQIIKYRQEQ